MSEGSPAAWARDPDVTWSARGWPPPDVAAVVLVVLVMVGAVVVVLVDAAVELVDGAVVVLLVDVLLWVVCEPELVVEVVVVDAELELARADMASSSNGSETIARMLAMRAGRRDEESMREFKDARTRQNLPG